MKNTKMNKIIKYLSISFAIILAILSISLAVLSIINWDVFPDAQKHIIYNYVRFSLLGIVAASICVPVLSSIVHFKHSKHNLNWIIDTIKICLVYVVIILAIIFLLVLSTKYGIHIELWYAHKQLFACFLVALSCWYFESFLSNTNKILVNNKNDCKSLSCQIFRGFIIKSAWITLCSILGLATMFNFTKISHFAFAFSLLLVGFIVLNFGLMLYMIIKNKTKNTELFPILFVLIVSFVAAAFTASAYYSMFPIRIIETIHINNLTCVWSFVLMLLFVPTSIFTSKYLLKIK